jgi:cytochrome c oxidase cbb3-type subunit III
MQNAQMNSGDDHKARHGTTGHEWDGIEELNTPLPRWWLWTWYACILWSFAYWVVYPAIPLATSFTKGVFGWTSREQVVKDLDGLKALRGPMTAKIEAASLVDIEKTPELLSFARAQGSAAFAVNCSPCHGAGAQGAKGYPNLNDDDWLWGSTLEQIHQTLQHGIRWDADKETRSSMMPAFGRDGILKPNEISATADYVRSLSGLPTDQGADLKLGAKIFADNCAACHGEKGEGNQEVGAPNLSDKIWLYSPEKSAIMERITVGGGGVMPAWSARLDEATIKSLAVYVHTLGGGQ